MSNVNVTTKWELEGADQLVSKLNRIYKHMRGQVAKEAVDAGAKKIKSYARIEITRSGKFSKHQTGGLANSIQTSAYIVGDGAEAEINVCKVYARIQEFGGTIRPLPGNKTGFLWWRDPDTGELRRARQVTLKPRPYLQPAMQNHQTEIYKAMDKIFLQYLETERE